MEKLTFLELAKKVLVEAKRPLSPSEIWKLAVSKGYDRRLGSQGKTPAQTLYSAIFIDERDNANTGFVKYNTRPARYYLKTLVRQRRQNDLEKTAESEPAVPPIHSFKEAQLHPFLSYFIYQRLSAHSKTIRHNTSHKKEYGEWVHPDMIAVRYPNWQREVGELSVKFGDLGTKLFSFEIKRELTFSNLRESFFQAVSNSSWAHEGYLASADISTDADFRDELQRLATSFGVGIIAVDVEDPDSSDILIPARERQSLDWDALNKLAKMNPDAASLLDYINKAIQINDFKYGNFDPIDRPEPLHRRAL